MGTNSTRLLVAGCDGERTETLDRRMVITRLGEGVDETGRIALPAAERTIAALSSYRAALDQLRPAAVRAAATSVLRDCENGEEFLDSAAEAIGTRPEILSGEEEARLSYLGAASDLADDCPRGAGPLLIFDIGGGSTELMLGEPAGCVSPARGGTSRPVRQQVASVDIGCVRMSERFLAEDPPSPAAVSRMEAHITGELKPVLERLLPGRPSCAVGLAGTVTTLSGIRLGLKEYDTGRIHHSRLTLREVGDIYRRLAALPLDERKTAMGLEPGRADVIVGGAAVLFVLMSMTGLDEILVSEKDILDGLVLDLYRSMKRG